jgi:hypothetical protein
VEGSGEVIEAIVLGGGLVVGLSVGRWLTLRSRLTLDAWVAPVTEVDDVPAWFLGLGSHAPFRRAHRRWRRLTPDHGAVVA